MAKPEWGTKRKCLSCGASFYDMRKKQFTCPKCGAEYDAQSLHEAKLEAALKNASNLRHWKRNWMKKILLLLLSGIRNSKILTIRP